MITANGGIPDLLRRFVAAPHKATGCCGDSRIALQTNDPELASALAVRDISSNEPSLNVRIIRDEAAPLGVSNVTLLEAWPLTTLQWGTGTVLTLDHERCEALGFLASSVSNQQFLDEVLPTLLNRLRQTDRPACDPQTLSSD